MGTGKKEGSSSEVRARRAAASESVWKKRAESPDDTRDENPKGFKKHNAQRKTVLHYVNGALLRRQHPIDPFAVLEVFCPIGP